MKIAKDFFVSTPKYYKINLINITTNTKFANQIITLMWSSRFVIITLLVLTCCKTFSQDSTLIVQKPTNLKRGIYFTYEAFCKNVPNISDSFSIEKDYRTDEDDNIKSDSTFKGYILN